MSVFDPLVPSFLALSCVDVLESRTVEGNGGSVCASNRDEKESVGTPTSSHADDHGQTGGDILYPMRVEGSGGAIYANCGDKYEDTWARTSIHVDEHG